MQKKIMVIILATISTATFAQATSKINSEVTSPKTAAPLPKKSREVKIKAHINPEELGYSKFFSTYYPETFKVRANGKEIYSIKNKNVLLQDKEITIPIDEDKVTIEYEYEWDMITSKRIGTKQVEFKVNNKADNLNLEFDSWKKDNRIVISQANQIGTEQDIKQGS